MKQQQLERKSKPHVAYVRCVEQLLKERRYLEKSVIGRPPSWLSVVRCIVENISSFLHSILFLSKSNILSPNCTFTLHNSFIMCPKHFFKLMSLPRLSKYEKHQSSYIFGKGNHFFNKYLVSKTNKQWKMFFGNIHANHRPVRLLWNFT